MRFSGPNLSFLSRTRLLRLAACSITSLIFLAFPLPSPGQPPLASAFSSAEPVPAYIAPEQDFNRPGDRQLAQWALEAWRSAAGDTLSFEFVDEDDALLRLYWVPARGSLYGEMRPIRVRGRDGAAVFVRPEMNGLGDEIESAARADPLFRDTVVYLTCLHELGHALGLDHTANYADIMFFFGYGGDILNYFMRYRRKLDSRDDIASNSGLSPLDIRRLRSLHPPSPN